MDNKLIYDVGMYDGADTAAYLAQGYRVLAIEANPEFAALAETRFVTEIANGRLHILNVAVAADSGTARLWVPESPARLNWTTLNRDELVSRGVPMRHIDVEARTFSSILAEYGVPYYLKIDIEGHDHYVLDALDPDDLPHYCSFELGYNRARFGDLYLFLIAARKGFSAYKLLSQSPSRQLHFEPYALGPALLHAMGLERLEHRSRELASAVVRRASSCGSKYLGSARSAPYAGNAWTRAYPADSSGPFGETTPGEWMEPLDVLFTWLAHRVGYTHGRYGSSMWYDMHCRA